MAWRVYNPMTRAILAGGNAPGTTRRQRRAVRRAARAAHIETAPTVIYGDGLPGDPNHPDPGCRVRVSPLQETYCNIYGTSYRPEIPQVQTGTRMQISSPFMAPGRPLPTARARGRRIEAGGYQPRYVPKPDDTPQPNVYCDDIQANSAIWDAWREAHRHVLYAYTMIDIIYQKSLHDSAWAKCLWEEPHPNVIVPSKVTGGGTVNIDYGAPTPQYWFGSYDKTRLEKIRWAYTSLLDWFDDPPEIFCWSRRYESPFDEEDYQCGLGGRGAILVCPDQVHPPALASGLLIHELIHNDPPKYMHENRSCAGLDEPWSGTVAAAHVAQHCPAYARKNPDNLRGLATAIGFALNDGAASNYGGNFVWGGFCQPSGGGGGGGIPHDCIWEWDAQMNTTTCLSIEPDWGGARPKGPSLGAPPQSKGFTRSRLRR